MITEMPHLSQVRSIKNLPFLNSLDRQKSSAKNTGKQSEVNNQLNAWITLDNLPTERNSAIIFQLELKDIRGR